ncbi:neuronal PAS domain-containing protein 4-like [Aulostomus maculatus]
MTMWCNTCRSHVNTPCVSHHQDHRRSFCRRFRSTKGASKARRDHINHEIRNMRALLPISREDQERLSYLHSMAAICTFIRKSVLLQELVAVDRSPSPLPYQAFLQALHGFILVSTAQGRLVYVSENVTDYLGLSMVDVLQGDTVYDMVECSDIDTVKSNLEKQSEKNSSSERSFICCMQTSRAFKLQHGSCSMLVRGTFQSLPLPHPSSSDRPTTEPLFIALCTPTVNRLRSVDSHFCRSFSSVHGLDMSFTHLSESVLYFLGHSAEELAGRSWYSLVHPEDLSLSSNSHKSITQADEDHQVEMVLRLQCKDLSWTWIYVRATKEHLSVVCANYIISETEARFLQTKVSNEAFSPTSLVCSSLVTSQQASQSYNNKCCKRQRTSDSQSEEPRSRVRRESEQDIHYMSSASSLGDSPPAPLGDSPALFTPPYSPASSSSPLQQEELSHDLLMDVHGYTDELLSSPEGSPSYYSYPEAALTCHLSPPESLPAAAEQIPDQGAFGPLGSHSPASSSSPTYDFQASDARLVPDCLSDMCESPVDFALHQDDFNLLEQPQEGSLHPVHLVPQHMMPLHSSLLTPNQSPAAMVSNQYSEIEQAEISILAQQISSLASSFDIYHTRSPLQITNTLPSVSDWSHHPPPSSVPPLKRDQPLDDGMFDSILKDLDIVTWRTSSSGSVAAHFSYQQDLDCGRRGVQQSGHEPYGLSLTVPGDTLPAGGVIMGPFSLQLGCHDQNTGLHQLNHYMQSSLQQDDMLMFKLSIRTWKKGDSSDLESDVVDFQAQLTLGFTENDLKKRKYPVKRSSLGENAVLAAEDDAPCSDQAQTISKWFLEHDNQFPGLKRPPHLNPAEHLWDAVRQESHIVDVQLTNLQELILRTENVTSSEKRQK